MMLNNANSFCNHITTAWKVGRILLIRLQESASFSFEIKSSSSLSLPMSLSSLATISLLRQRLRAPIGSSFSSSFTTQYITRNISTTTTTTTNTITITIQYSQRLLFYLVLAISNWKIRRVIAELARQVRVICSRDYTIVVVIWLITRQNVPHFVLVTAKTFIVSLSFPILHFVIVPVLFKFIYHE